MTKTASQRVSLFNALHALSDEITTSKQAAARMKRAEGATPKDPGGYQGASTHPTVSVPNNGQTAVEGARSTENEDDVNQDQGATSVNNAADAKPGQQDSVQLNIGTQQSATGEDASVEDNYKGGKDDPGSTHPARTDNESLDGRKYANAKFEDLHKEFDRLSHSLLADIANGYGNQLTKASLDAAARNSANLNPVAAGASPSQKVRIQGPSDTLPTVKQAAAPVTEIDLLIKQARDAVASGHLPQEAAASRNADLAAGYELAAHLGLDKQAAQRLVGETLASTMNDAILDAELLGSYLVGMVKRAEEEEGDEEDEAGGEPTKPSDETSGANQAEGVSGGGGLGSGGAPGGSLGDALGGNVDPAGLAASGGEGDVSQEEALMQLVAALDELGIPIEELAQANGGMPAGDPAAGGPPVVDPAMGGLPPAAAAAGPPAGMTEGMKLASAAKAFRRSGRYQFKTANSGTLERQIRDEMKGYLIELMNASTR